MTFHAIVVMIEPLLVRLHGAARAASFISIHGPCPLNLRPTGLWLETIQAV